MSIEPILIALILAVVLAECALVTQMFRANQRFKRGIEKLKLLSR